MPAARSPPSIATFVQVGIGIVRTRPCFPTQVHDAPPPVPLLDVPERERRAPPNAGVRSQGAPPGSRGRGVLWSVLASGVFSSVCACLTVSQLPKRTPLDATPFTRVIPLASSGAPVLDSLQ